MAERDLWKTMHQKMKHYGHFERIENLVSRGRPDVNYCINGVEGNIELKQLPCWPAKDGIVKVKHFTPQQRNWIRRRCAAKGKVYVLLEVVNNGNNQPVYSLLSGQWAVDYLGTHADRYMIYRHAIVSATGAFPTQDVLNELIRK